MILDHPRLGKLFIISAHLDAGTSRDAFEASLTDWEYLVTRCPNDANLICGVDANSNLAAIGANDRLVGPVLGTAEHSALWKSRLVGELVCAHDLIAANTFCESPSSDDTCYHDGRVPPIKLIISSYGALFLHSIPGSATRCSVTPPFRTTSP